jgi:hypothetical protein
MQPEISPHALWLWTLAGAHQDGPVEEDVYFGTQDNGSWFTLRAGALDPPGSLDWVEAVANDSFDIAATRQNIAHHFNVGPTVTTFSRGFGPGGRNIDFGNPSSIPPGLSGTPAGFRFLDTIDEWGDDDFAMATLDSPRGPGGLFITEDNGFTWRELGTNNNEPPAMCAVQAAFRGRMPVFYVQAGFCETHNLSNRDQLWAFIGTDAAGRWQQIRLPGEAEAVGISIFGADRSNANRLYASLITRGENPRVIFSSNGGRSWQRDTELDDLMQGFGTFRYQTRFGPPIFRFFVGYPQPTLFAFDPEDRNMIVAGGHDSGVFLSRDRGRNWRLVTDPFDPAGSGIPHLTSPRFAYFDHDPPDEIHVYIGTVGRGVWRMAIQKPPGRLVAGPSPVQ